jgi:hypothetical protein
MTKEQVKTVSFSGWKFGKLFLLLGIIFLEIGKRFFYVSFTNTSNNFNIFLKMNCRAVLKYLFIFLEN